jgi:type VI secretion system secreted protein VgrG
VRVSASWAGNQLGETHIPRIGQEVVVDFINGDPDLPIVTGRHYNAVNLPPWSLPGQSALSGVRSRELTAGGGNSAAGQSNHLVFDDSAEQIQVQLKSDHQSSSLSLGSITRIEDNAGRKDARGEGFELRTDGHGVVRAGDGLLVSTQGRGNARAHAKDMGETTERLNTAQGQHEGLAQAAETAKAMVSKDQAAVAKAIEQQNKAIEGDKASAGGGGGSAGDSSSANFPELQEPHLVLASAAGIAATTPESLHVQAGEHIALTAQAHLSLSAGKRWFVSAKDGIRQFALNDGIRWMAGKGRVQIEAHKDKINVTAKEAVRITSTHDTITISAPTKVTVNGGGSFTEWSGSGILHGTTGSWVEHAGGHVQMGGKSLPLTPENFKACSQEEGDAAAGGGRSLSA